MGALKHLLGQAVFNMLLHCLLFSTLSFFFSLVGHLKHVREIRFLSLGQVYALSFLLQAAYKK